MQKSTQINIDNFGELSESIEEVHTNEDPEIMMYSQIIHAALALFNLVIVPLFNITPFSGSSGMVYVSDTAIFCHTEDGQMSVYFAKHDLLSVSTTWFIAHELMHTYTTLNLLGRGEHIFRGLGELNSMVAESKTPGVKIEYISYRRLYLLLHLILKMKS